MFWAQRLFRHRCGSVACGLRVGGVGRGGRRGVTKAQRARAGVAAAELALLRAAEATPLLSKPALINLEMNGTGFEAAAEAPPSRSSCRAGVRRRSPTFLFLPCLPKVLSS